MGVLDAHVESAFRHRYLHGPAVLYDDLMAIAAQAVTSHGPMATERMAWQLAVSGPCHLCAMGIGPGTAGFIRDEQWRAAQNATGWLDFLIDTRALWHPHVCGRCDHSGRPARCRQHWVEHLANGRSERFSEVDRVRWIADHVHHYDRSFRWECQGSDTSADHAALVAAIGWCGGWSTLLALVSASKTCA